MPLSLLRDSQIDLAPLKTIWKLNQDGSNPSDIVDTLNTGGFRTRYNDPWTQADINDLLPVLDSHIVIDTSDLIVPTRLTTAVK